MAYCPMRLIEYAEGSRECVDCHVPLEAGAKEPIHSSSDQILGYALRSKRNTKLIYASPGHLCGVDAALGFVLEHLDGYRIPYPTRLAHDASNDARKVEDV